MTDVLSYAYMQRGLIAAVLIGGVCGVIAVYVVLKGLSFIGAGISHASFGGVAIGLSLGINPVFTAVLFCLLVAWGIGSVSRRGHIKEDTAVGVFFASTMAVGALLVSLMRGYQVDLMSYLFGSIISVTREDLWTTAVVTSLVIALVWFFYKDLLFVVFDMEMAWASGLPANFLYNLLLSMMALVIVVSIKVVGIVLVSALVVIPAATALQITENFHRMMLISALVGVGSCVLGLFIADWLGVAPGATIVLLATAIFILSVLVSPVRTRRLA